MEKVKDIAAAAAAAGITSTEGVGSRRRFARPPLLAAAGHAEGDGSRPRPPAPAGLIAFALGFGAGADAGGPSAGAADAPDQSLPRLGFIGIGTINTAVIRGLLTSPRPPACGPRAPVSAVLAAALSGRPRVSRALPLACPNLPVPCACARSRPPAGAHRLRPHPPDTDPAASEDGA